MTFSEFKRAAKKHLKICECLIENCNLSDWQIKEGIYYLSGYVVEMMLKYRIYKRINFKHNEDIKNLNRKDISYQNDIANSRNGHNIRYLLRKLRQYEEMALFKDIEHYYNWSINIRYNGTRKVYNRIRYTYELAKRVFEKLG